MAELHEFSDRNHAADGRVRHDLQLISHTAEGASTNLRGVLHPYLQQLHTNNYSIVVADFVRQPAKAASAVRLPVTIGVLKVADCIADKGPALDIHALRTEKEETARLLAPRPVA